MSGILTQNVCRLVLRGEPGVIPELPLDQSLYPPLLGKSTDGRNELGVGFPLDVRIGRRGQIGYSIENSTRYQSPS
jgi:hypothetical protein